MPGKPDYDVVVVGAGVSGLLIASELATRHRVLVIERGRTLSSAKYWLTDQAVADSNPHLSQAVDSYYPSLDFIAHDESSYRCYGHYALWDTGRLLQLLGDKIVSAGGAILLGHAFYSYREYSGGIAVQANDSSVSTRLLIDCMGYASPIIYAKDAISVAGYYLLYGGTFSAAREIEPVGLHNLCISARPTYVEAFPTKDGKLHLVLILASRSVEKIHSLKEQFAFIVNRSPYSNVIAKDDKKREFLGGIIPVGRMTKTALSRIFFFGEAGQVNPAATATALTQMLSSYRATAALLSRCLENDTLGAQDLRAIQAHRPDRLNDAMHLALFKSVLEWNSDKFAVLVREMKAAGNHDLVNAIMFGRVSYAPKDLFSTLRSLARARSFGILNYITQGVRKRYSFK